MFEQSFDATSPQQCAWAVNAPITANNVNELLPINSWTYIAEGGPTDRIGRESVCKSHTKSRERATPTVKQYNENYLWTVITVFL